MTTYRQKVEKIKTIQNYLIAQIQTISNFLQVSGSMSDLTACIDYPGCFILYANGSQVDVREVQNAVINFDIVIKNRLENEMDNLDLAALIMEKFEANNLGGNCIGMTSGWPQNFYSALGESKTVETVISLNIEI